MRPLFLIAAVAFALPAPARANDSAAATAIGGLVLQKSDVIRMDSEDLFLSEKLVRVRYQFTNTSAHDVETLVAFPLPDFEASPAVATPNYKDDLKFTTLVNGQPAQLSFVEQAFFKGHDVSARVRAAGLPLMPTNEAYDAAIKKVPPAALRDLQKAGLVENIGDEKNPEWLSKWSTRTSITRKQVFPAGKTISVEHSYVPMLGGSVGGAFAKEYRKEQDFRDKRRTYCIDDDFLRSFDAREAKLGKAYSYSEIWLSYVLKSGANWAGPIGNFRLVVDKSEADYLVSFCGSGVKKIGPTQFEVRYQNFVPKDDLNVLIVKFHKM